MNAASPYARVASTGLSGRDLTAAVLRRCATDLEEAALRLPLSGPVDRAIARNRDLWCLLGADACEPDTPLAPETCRNIKSLTRYMLDRTFIMGLCPEPEVLSAMARVNRLLAEGFSARPEAPAPVSQPGGSVRV
jgi:hypothetical protein